MTQSESRSRAESRHLVSRASLCVIVAVYAALAAFWVIRTPPFTPPDELAHTDYVFAFLDAGEYYRVESVLASNDVLPQTQYIERVSNYRKLHYNPYARLSEAGTLFGEVNKLDPNAPMPSGRAPAAGSTMPYTMFVYPATYYLVVAEFARLATIGAPRAVVAAFYLARAVNVLLGVGTLLLMFPTLRRFGFNVQTSLFGVLGVAMLPLFCWVSAYIQPDNLVVFLVTLAFFAAGGRRRSLPLLAFAVAALILVKPHYGAALWLPSMLYAFSLRRTNKLRDVVLFGVIPLLSFFIAMQLTPVTGGLRGVSATAQNIAGTGVSGIAAISESLVSVIASVYFGGLVFTNYWLGYGTHGFYLPLPQAIGVSRVFLALTLPALFGCIIVYARRAYRIVNVGLRRGWRPAFCLFSRGLSVNVYVTFTTLLLAASVLGTAPLSLEARYWLPILVPTTLIVFRDLPQLLQRRFRERASLGIASALILMTLPINLLTPGAIERDFYQPTNQRPKFDGGALVLNADGHTMSFHARECRVSIGSKIVVRGFAIDLASGLPNDRVTIVSDGRPIARARQEYLEAEPIAEWHDRMLEQSGFVAIVPASKFGLGKHRVGALVWRHGSVELPLEHVVELDVTS